MIVAGYGFTRMTQVAFLFSGPYSAARGVRSNSHALTRMDNGPQLNDHDRLDIRFFFGMAPAPDVLQIPPRLGLGTEGARGIWDRGAWFSATPRSRLRSVTPAHAGSPLQASEHARKELRSRRRLFRISQWPAPGQFGKAGPAERTLVDGSDLRI